MMNWVAVYKFFHIISMLVLCATFLLNYVAWCVLPWSSSQKYIFLSFAKLRVILPAALLTAMLTGGLLIYPKGYSVHTPWIEAAFALLMLIVCLWFFSQWMITKWSVAKHRVLILLGVHFVYAAVFFFLFLIVHDAVTKTTWVLL